METALSTIDQLITTFEEEKKSNSTNNSVTNCKDIKCNQCGGTLLFIDTATSIIRNKSINIHEYKGQNMENVNEFWMVDKLTNFESVSVSRAVNFGSDNQIKEIISVLLNNNENINNYQLRYLMCSGPTMDLNALLSGKGLNTPQICEKLIIGCAVFEGKNYKSGYIVKNRVKH